MSCISTGTVCGLAGDASFRGFHAMAKAGGNLSVVFLGGSLTWGANASDPQLTSYRALIADRLRQEYPLARFRFWDAAIGGTGSQLAVFRLDRDVFSRRPDLVFVDFAINDDIYSNSTERSASYEALIRRLISEAHCPVVEVILAAKEHTRPGELARMPRRDAHLAIARAYHAGVGDAVSFLNDRVQRGLVNADDLWLPNDPTHPVDAGYAEYAQAVWAGFQKAIADNLVCRVPEKWLYADTYQQGVRFRLSSLGTLPAGWTVGEPNHVSAYFDMMMSRWLDDEVIASNQQTDRVERLRVRFRGTMVMLFGEGTPQSGKYRVYFDGKLVEHQEGDRVLREFDAGSIAIPSNGNTHHCSVLAENLKPLVEHTLEIEPVFESGANQELRLESICVAGGNPQVMPAAPGM